MIVRSLKTWFLALIFFLLISTAYAQKHFDHPPKLIVGITIEEMRYEMLLRYWEVFTDQGFRKLVDQGVLCTQVHHNYLITQNAPGQASIVTGTYPSYHGIVADQWHDKLGDKNVGAADEKRYNLVNGRISLGNFTPRNLLASTIGDELKLATRDSSKVISIAANPVSSVISGGRLADYAFWFNDEDGKWITGNYYLDSLPDWVHRFHEKDFRDIYMEQTWSTFHSLEQNYQSSLPDDNPFEIGIRLYRYTFPYDLNYLKNRSGNYKYLKYTPFGNTYTKDFAISAIVGEQLGEDQYTDFLTISFSASSYAGDLFGPRSVEIEDIFLRLDRDIGHLVNFLEDHLGLEDVLIYITSDRGVADVPEYLKFKKQNAGVFDPDKALSLLNSYLSILYGDGDWIAYYQSGQLYLTQQMIDQSGVSLREIQEQAAGFLVQYTGVADAVPGISMVSQEFSTGIKGKMQRSYHQKRSGDVLINLEPGWIEKDGKATGSGSGYNYDTHVPLIWYGWEVNSKRIDQPQEIINIAPTISGILNITAPNASLGRPIYEIFQQ
ncbi:MAG: alkaline phosphatase family protein [Bacteroidales bacterium]|jgi:predicted AlkP superfamily pyrophosphatase or phosphodiesterase|nr:alkaline phosphatase family protein [Bacteroidales bacterium]